MKAAKMKERPDYTLMTQNDVQNACYMQMPRWLFSDLRYAGMSLEAKLAYTFLLNRFQLSRRNGWINDQGEVFVIFPRKSLAQELRISEKKVTASMRKLAEMELIWEKRCGLGRANQIYLAKVCPQNDPNYSCAPFLPPENHEDFQSDDAVMGGDNGIYAETVVPPLHADAMPASVESCSPGTTERPVFDNAADQKPIHIGSDSVPSGLPVPIHEPQNQRLKDRRTNDCRTVDSAVQEPLNRRASKKDISQKEKSQKKVSQSVSAAPACAKDAPGRNWPAPACGVTAPFAYGQTAPFPYWPESVCGATAPFRDWTAPMDGLTDRQTDFGDGNNLRCILDGCELETFTPDTALLFETAVERLYYSKSVKIGNAIMPQDRVRSRLYLLDGDVLREAERKLSEYGGRRIRNRVGYTMTTIFNCVAEREDYLPRSFRGCGRDASALPLLPHKV